MSACYRRGHMTAQRRLGRRLDPTPPRPPPCPHGSSARQWPDRRRPIEGGGRESGRGEAIAHRWWRQLRVGMGRAARVRVGGEPVRNVIYSTSKCRSNGLR
jgi:hypothetical protein